MSTLSRVFVVAVVGLTMVPAHQALAAPSVDEIIGKYVEAVGGKDTLMGIDNRVTKGKFSLPDMGMEAPMETIIDPPNMWSEINVESMGMVVHRGMSYGVAWELNPMQGPRILEGPAKAAMKRQASIEPFLNWKDYYESAEVEGEEAYGDEGDKTAYKVAFTTPDGDTETYFFDKDSGLIVQNKTTQEGMEIMGTIQGYEEFDGVKIPTIIVQSGGMMGTVSITLDSVEHNVEIEEGKFDLPDEIKALQEGGEGEGSESKEKGSESKEKEATTEK